MTSRRIDWVGLAAKCPALSRAPTPFRNENQKLDGANQRQGRVASYPAAMQSLIAKRKCPELIFMKPRFDAYKAISLQIRDIFAEYTPVIEPLSLDEAYLE
jgi:DNA polymerase IV